MFGLQLMAAGSKQILKGKTKEKLEIVNTKGKQHIIYHCFF